LKTLWETRYLFITGTMAEDLIIDKNANKEIKYQSLLPQIKGLITSEENLISNLANISAALYQTFQFLWCGFYLVDQNKDELVLGPFQGPIACTRIKFGKGVCGTSWKKQETIIVPDVDKFPGHIACSSLSKSEIVVPAIASGKVFLVLDIDSKHINHFDKTDKKYLEEISNMLIEKHYFG